MNTTRLTLIMSTPVTDVTKKKAQDFD